MFAPAPIQAATGAMRVVMQGLGYIFQTGIWCRCHSYPFQLAFDPLRSGLQFQLLWLCEGVLLA
jgi:hypothetical protein